MALPTYIRNLYEIKLMILVQDNNDEGTESGARKKQIFKKETKSHT